jgi:hypothetical protein
MPKAILVLGTNPVSAEREDEYDFWYTSAHIGDVAKLDGVNSARRYVLSPVRPASGAPESPYRYLAIDEIEVGDLQCVTDDLLEAQTSARMVLDRHARQPGGDQLVCADRGRAAAPERSYSSLMSPLRCFFSGEAEVC